MSIRFLAPILCATVLTACSQKEQEAAAATPTGSATATVATASAPSTSALGAGVYNKTCFVCHGSGAGGAPAVGVREDWAPRSAQGQDALYRHAIEGFTGDKGVMPAKGANPALTDEEVKAAVDYMQSQSQ